jgi:acylpyruvate hydrolase
MRLVTYAGDRGSVAAVLTAEEDKVALVGPRRGSVYADAGALLRAGKEGLARASDALEGGEYSRFQPERLLRPILRPGAIVCVGLNYRTHILEMGRDLPEHPTYFGKLSRALTDPFADIVLPQASERVDYEGELAVVIGRGGRNIGQADAWDAVAGLTLMNDVTMRDFQRRTKQWFAGKTWERSTPIGPSVVTRDEVGDPNGLELTVTVNGELRQVAPIADLVFGIPSLVADLSRIVTLEPGDLIATGTPGGVGAAMTPERFLADGDVVEVAVSELGTLRNRFRRETPLQVA